MATITKRVDKRLPSSGAYQYWDSNENNDSGTAIAQGDIFMIEHTLYRPAKYMWLETDASCDLKIRINNYYYWVPKKKAGVFGYQAVRDFDNSTWITDTTMAEIPILASQEWELQGAMPIHTLQVSTWSAGTFSLFVS
jgi:hypothetical protein